MNLQIDSIVKFVHQVVVVLIIVVVILIILAISQSRLEIHQQLLELRRDLGH